eukprot:jgi/Hompol1/2335/HPOL_005301-RA
MHLQSVNELLSRAFWPGIDVSENLLYPDFSVVVLYKRLVIACAFMTPEGYITYITVAPGWQGSGIASMMLVHLVQKAQAALHDLTLHVSANNPAMVSRIARLLTTSPVVSSQVLLGFRSVASLLTFAFLINESVAFGIRNFIFLTFLSWLGITVYFFTVTITSLVYRNADSATTTLPSWLSIALRYLFTSCSMISFIVLVIFWTLLFPGIAITPGYSLYLLVTPHVANFVIMQIEIQLTKQSITLIDLAISLATLLVYTIWIWTTHYGFSVDFPYPFFTTLLDIKAKPGPAILWVIVFVALFAIMMGLIWGEVKLRDYLRRRSTSSKDTLPTVQQDHSDEPKIVV